MIYDTKKLNCTNILSKQQYRIVGLKNIVSSHSIVCNMVQENSTKGIAKVIFSSSLGTLIEWYDFYIFGMLAKTISVQFFPEGNETAALLSTLAIFAAGFLVRPFGALVFGRLGDLIGRKYTFLLTLVLMGGSTFLIGLVPSYKTIGMAAPLLVLLLRLIQGLALGWRIWRRCYICGRACTIASSGIFYGMDTNYGHAGFVCSIGCDNGCKNSRKNRCSF